MICKYTSNPRGCVCAYVYTHSELVFVRMCTHTVSLCFVRMCTHTVSLCLFHLLADPAQLILIIAFGKRDTKPHSTTQNTDRERKGRRWKRVGVGRSMGGRGEKRGTHRDNWTDCINRVGRMLDMLCSTGLRSAAIDQRLTNS